MEPPAGGRPGGVAWRSFRGQHIVVCPSRHIWSVSKAGYCSTWQAYNPVLLSTPLAHTTICSLPSRPYLQSLLRHLWKGRPDRMLQERGKPIAIQTAAIDCQVCVYAREHRLRQRCFSGPSNWPKRYFFYRDNMVLIFQDMEQGSTSACMVDSIILKGISSAPKVRSRA